MFSVSRSLFFSFFADNENIFYVPYPFFLVEELPNVQLPTACRLTKMAMIPKPSRLTSLVFIVRVSDVCPMQRDQLLSKTPFNRTSPRLKGKKGYSSLKANQIYVNSLFHAICNLICMTVSLAL